MPALDYLTVVLLGGFVGVTELVARYRDAPVAALRAVAAYIYIALNAGAAAGALALIKVFGWSFGQPAGSAAERWTRVLIAGFGAMAFFRSSLFIVRVGDSDVGVGPSSFLQVLLAAADRAVDRRRAFARAAAIGPLMAGVSFAKAVAALPTYCLNLMQNLSTTEQAELGRDVQALADTKTMNEDVKVLNLGLSLMNLVGPGVLTAAIASLGARITESGTTPPTAPSAPSDVPAGEAETSGLPPVPPSPGSSAGDRGA